MADDNDDDGDDDGDDDDDDRKMQAAAKGGERMMVAVMMHACSRKCAKDSLEACAEQSHSRQLLSLSAARHFKDRLHGPNAASPGGSSYRASDQSHRAKKFGTV